MKKGDIVFNEYHGIRRYGIVEKKERADDGWAYCKVEWINDDLYQRSMEDRKSLTGGKNWSLDVYRVDMLKTIDLEKEMETFKAIEYILQTRGKNE
tara:strand:+ start:340 stop:627 length:288 start_codon:yes stop_codon:yes gene_type:complete